MDTLDHGPDLANRKIAAVSKELRKRQILLLAVYAQAGSVDHAASELDFRPDSPYKLVCDPLAPEPYQVKPEDRLVVITSEHRARADGIRISNLDQYADTRHFRPGRECILVLTHHNGGNHLPRVLRRLDHRVLLITIDPQADRSPGSVEDDCWTLPSFEAAGLEGLVEHHRDTFAAATRAFVIAPPRSGRDGHRGAIYQDDTILSCCMALKDVYERRLGKLLTI